jgi:PAS domain S-box-containing protein
MTHATLLIVEDDGILAANLEGIVNALGYGVLGPVATGEEAIALLQDHPADLVLMDIELAGKLNGIETAGIITRTSDIPIVFLTGFSHTPVLEQAKSAAPYGYLIKPVSERELAATVAMSLHRHALDRQLKESRQALAESEAKYRHLFAHAPLGIFRTTLDGKALLVNAEMARMVGCATPEEAISEFTDLARQLYADPGKREEFVNLLRLHGEVRNFVYRARQKNGEHLWISMTARLSANSGTENLDGPVIDGFAMDITDRKMAEEARHTTLERVNIILSNLHPGILLVSSDDRVEFVNQSFCDLFDLEERPADLLGVPAPELLGKMAAVFADPPGAIARIQEIVLRQQPIKNEEVALRSERTYLCDFIPITVHGKTYGRLWHHHDITDRRRTEEALEKRMLALIQPLDSPEGIAIEELFNLQDLQRIQDGFAEATGVASMITHTDGKPITKPSNFCRLCAEIIRKNEKGRSNCFKSDALIGRACVAGPTVQPCLSGGLWDAGAGITVGGRHIANWLIGQVRDETQTEEQMRIYAREIGADEEAVVDAFREIPAMARERFEKIALALFTLASQLSASAYQNVQQARFIAESRKAKQALQESEERLQSLFRVAPTGIGVVRNRTIVEVNPRICAMTGYTAEELIARNARILYPTQEAYAYVGTEKYRQMHETGIGVIETRWQRKDGTILDILMASTPLDAADFSKGAIFTALDITERKQTEALLRESEARYRELVENANSIILRMDREGRILFFNEYAQRFFGYGAGEVLGRSVLGTIVPDIDSAGKDLQALIADIGRRPELHAINENENMRRDGTRVWIAWTNKPFYNEAGEVSEILCVGNDMTERKRAEEEKRQLQTQLLHAQKLEAIGTLAGGIAHDFNNILAAIIGYTDMAKEELPAGTPLAKDLDQVLKASNRARDLVKQILTFSRQAETEPVNFYPAAVVKEVVRLLRPTLPATIAIHQHIDEKAGPVHIDPAQMHQVLMNLCTNAFHAMEAHGGELDISLRRIELDTAALAARPYAQPGAYIELAIGDTGTGIPQNLIDRIFDPFFTTKELGKGTGMGLSIVHGIAKSCAGFVTVDSVLGRGTTFHVFLPVAAEEQPFPVSTEDSLPRGSEHILFIDDEEMLTSMAKTMLERLGYLVTARTSSLEALTAFQNQPDRFDLVITDLTMPGMTGLDLSRRLLQIRPDLPIILCTGFSALVSEEKARSMGIRALAFKPLTKKDMALLIRKILEKDPS